MPAPSEVEARQAPLVEHYRQSPQDAVITKQARTVSRTGEDPFHVAVTVDGPYEQVVWPLGIDEKVGGDHDLANPGEMLLAALAACLASTLRMLADRLQVGLNDLVVVASGDVDARGCLAVDRDVRVGFDTIQVDVTVGVPDDVDPQRVQLLQRMGEQLCPTADTIRQGAPIEVAYEVRQGAGATS